MSRVLMYTKRDCLFSDEARAFLDEKGIPYDEVDISDDPEARAEMIEASAGAETTPQIFIDGNHIGGFDDLVEEDHEGRLAAAMALGLEVPAAEPR